MLARPILQFKKIAMARWTKYEGDFQVFENELPLM